MTAAEFALVPYEVVNNLKRKTVGLGAVQVRVAAWFWAHWAGMAL